MTASPLLTIAIPTFNRYEKLELLFDSFLSGVSSIYSGQVEIIVCDNSENSIAEKNRELLNKTKIKYKRNLGNIGFAGNIIRCVNDAQGCFLWIISDDDSVDLSEFGNLMSMVINLRDQDVGCIMLPFLNSDAFGRTRLSNTASQWGVSGQTTTFRKIMRNSSQLPFILFSGAIISKRNYTKKKVENLEKVFGNNDFIQIPLFLEVITLDAKVEFYPNYLQGYKVADTIRFNLDKMFSSMLDVISYYFISNPTLYRKYLLRNYQLWVGWFLWDRAGLVVVPGASSFRNQLVSNIKSCISFKNICLTILMFAPRSFLRIGYASYVVVSEAIIERQFNIYKMWKRVTLYTSKMKR